MSYSWPLAPTVSPGEPITSTQLAGLANAWNARLRSGIGDCAQRVHYYTRNAFLAMVNPSGDVPWPQSHFLYQRQAPEPENAEWPDGEPGFDNGAAIGSNWPAYVFGSEDLGINDEATRLNDPTYGGLPVDPGGTTGRHYWELGKAQRGAYDAGDGAIACPAFTAARSYAAIRWRWWSPQGSSFGGYFPTPEVSATPCEDPNTSDDYPPPPNLDVFFTNLEDATIKSYAGTCSDGPDLSTPGMYDSHVYAIGYAPWAYYVVLNDGTVEELPTNLWVEGPYTGEPKLSRRWGNHLERSMHRFAGEFRGVEANEQAMRGRSRDYARKAADFRRIVGRQYLLAPARGIHGGGYVTPIYHTLTVPAGGESAAITADAGFVLAAFMAEGDAGAAVEALDASGAVLAQATANPGGSIGTLHPAPESLRFRSVSGGGVQIEVAELMQYTPAPWDVFLVMRLGGARL